MSHEGQKRRGQKWWNQRNIDGVLPEGIAKDKAKMSDVEYYLEWKKVEDAEKVKEKKKGGK